MAIQKQEFYEGAALHQIACTGAIARVKYDAPMFLLNDYLCILVKYCTKNRSPWAFTFAVAEQQLLLDKSANYKVVVGLVCGGDGIAALDLASYLKIAAICETASVHVACYRKRGEHYQISGPDGPLDGKVPPSKWRNVLTWGSNP